jgi:hypothetical protein
MMGDGAEELVGDVGEDRRAAHGDAILHHEDEEFGEELIDFLGGLKVVELDQEVGGEVDVHGLQWLEFQGRMAKAEAGAECGKATLATASSEMTALLVASGDGGCAGGAGAGCLGVHFYSFLEGTAAGPLERTAGAAGTPPWR